MTDLEREQFQKEYREQNGIDVRDPRLPDEDNLPRETVTRPRVTDNGEASAAAASANFKFEPSSKVSAADLMNKVASYKKTNSDVIGWLYIPGTNINEPVVMDSVEPNSYYEARTWDGVNYPGNDFTNFKITATFADRRTRVGSNWGSASRNTVLYGHNWTNLRNPLDIGTNNNHVMFGQLPSFVDQTFAQTHPYIYYSTGANEGIWKVFAVYYCELSSAFPYNTPNPTPEAFAASLKEFKDRSIYDFSTDVNSNDRILTLSTCTRVYGDHGNQSYVVMARLLRTGESDNDPITVSVNTDMKRPLL
jgi:sortase B